MSTNGKSKYVFSANSAAWGRSITQRNNFVSEVLSFLESFGTEEGLRAMQEMAAIMGDEAALGSLLSDNAKSAALGFFGAGNDMEGGGSDMGEAIAEFAGGSVFDSGTFNIFTQLLSTDFTGGIGEFDPICSALGGYWSAVGTGKDTNIDSLDSQLNNSSFGDSNFVKLVLDDELDGPTYEDGSIYPTYTNTSRIFIDYPHVANVLSLVMYERLATGGMMPPYEDLTPEDKHAGIAGLMKLLRHALYFRASSNTYSTTATKMALPLNPVEMSYTTSGATSEYAIVDSEYNMFYQTYERVSKMVQDQQKRRLSGDTKLPQEVLGIENLLPNLPVIMAYESGRKQLRGNSGLRMTDNPDKSISLYNSNPKVFWNTFVSTVIGNMAQVSTPQGYDQKYIGRQTAKRCIRQMRNLVISTDDVRMLQDVENKRENFPMYVNVEFKADDTVPFVAAIEEAGLMNHLVTWIATNDQAGTRPTETYYEPTESWTFKMAEGTQRPSIAFDGTHLNVVKTERYTLDINDFYQAVTAADSNIPTAFNGVNTHIFKTQLGCDKIKSKLLSVVLKGKLKEQFEKNSETSLRDILSPELANSDTIAYKIEKRDEAGTLIQNIYIPNTNDQGIINYFDTQILYGKTYQYRVFAYQAIASVDYKYKNTVPTVSPGDGRYGAYYMLTAHVDELYAAAHNGASAEGVYPSEFYSDDELYDPAYVTLTNGEYCGVIDQQIEVTPKLKIVEVPIYAQQVKVLDSPPLPPEVNVIPMKNNSTELKMFLNAQVGRRQEDPVYILDEDTSDFNAQAMAQRLQPGDYMTFESDDRPAEFQIFRTEKHPVTWNDFANSLHETINTSLLTSEQQATGKIYGDNLYANAASFVDSIQENKKYYYMFRTVDSHGFVSNPSEIYEVEMVNNEGAIYLLKKEVDFAPPVPKTNKKKFKRYLKICPNVQNVMIDTNKYDSAFDAKSGGVSLGVQSETVWGKKFRFVVRSLKTGKEIHIDTDFTKRHIETAREKGDNLK